jgi:hypothetical protein
VVAPRPKTPGGRCATKAKNTRAAARSFARHSVPLDLALGQLGLQLVDAGGGGFGVAEVEGFQVRQVGEVLDAGVGQSALRLSFNVIQ